MRHITTAMFVAGALGILGCSVEVSGTGGMLPSGRSVTVTTDRVLGSTRCEAVGMGTESVELRSLLKTRKVLVEPTVVQVDGVAVAGIPEETKEVVIYDTRGRLRIAADGVSVYDTTF